MGVQPHPPERMRTIFLLLTVLAGFAAFAMPSQDETIPEVEFFQPDELDAVETVAAMKRKGATDADCLKVSKALFTMVKNEVKTEQNAIDVAINGAGKCNDKGANESAEAQKEQQKQNKKISSLKKKVTALKMRMIEVTIRRPFEELENGLNSKVSEASFLQELVEKVHAEGWKVNNLKKKLDQTKGKGKEADKSVVKARDKAENAKKDCRCKSYKADQAAVKDGEKNLERHSKAWAKSTAIKCAVMSGGKKCKTEAEPIVKKKSLPQGVNKNACPASKNAPTKGTGKHHQCSVKMQSCSESDKAWKAFKVDLKKDNPHLNVSKLKLKRGCKFTLSRKKLKKLPESFGCLTKLTWFWATDNRLKQIPNLKGLTSLTNLYLDQNNFKQLPENTFPLSLKKLTLSECHIKQLPKNVFKGLTSLKHLNLYKNDIKQLPENTFKGLKNLETLTLTKNDLTQLPNNVFKGLKNLKTLTLGDNRFKQVPENRFNGLTSL